MYIVRSVCPRDCYDTCFIEVAVEGGVIRSIRADPQNPLTGNFLCARGVADSIYVYRNRVLYPHINVGGKPSNNFKKVSWDEVLNLVVERLREVLDRYGPEKILHIEYAGNMGLLTWYLPQRLWNTIGATRTDYSICSRSGHEAIALHYGLSYGILPEEVGHMKLIILWGFNAAVSAPHIWRQAVNAKSRGGTIVVIDPRRCESTNYADIWISVKPGTDAWLAYGVAKVLIERGLIDRGFIERYTYGFDVFADEVAKYSLDWVSSITGVDRRDIEHLAELYASRKPSVIMIGLGMQKSFNGAEAVRIISLLPALVGIHRGFFYSNSRGFYIDTTYLTGERSLVERVRVVSQVSLAKHIAGGEFKFIYIYNMNPLLTLPGQRLLREGLSREDVFVVVHTPHWSETCLYSDVVLPAATYLEKEDVVIPYSHNYIRISRRAVEPLGESRDELWVVREMARRLGIEDPALYEDPLEALRRALEGALEGSFEELLSGKVLKLKYRARDEYQTPSGRIEFYSLKAVERGLSPIPRPVAVQIPEDSFILLNTASPLYTHTQFSEVYGEPKPEIHINPTDAESLAIVDMDVVEVCNENGCIRFTAKLDNRLPRGVLWIQRQIKSIDGEPLNLLMPIDTQAIGGGPIFNSTIVKIHRARQ